MPVRTIAFKNLRRLEFGNRTVVVTLCVFAISREAVEFFLVLCPAQFADIGVKFVAHFIELAALFFNSVDLGLAPIIEGDVACREVRTMAAMRTAATGKEAIGRLIGVTFET